MPLSVALRSYLLIGPWWVSVVWWACVSLIAGAMLASPLAPMVDYPQHVAMGAILHDLITHAPGSHVYQTSLFTYNGGVELLVALLSFVMHPEWAGRLVSALIIVLEALAVLSVLSYSQRPRWYALLFVPWLYNHIVGWGFGNFVLAVPLMILASTAWLRLVDGSRSKWHILQVTVLSLAVAYTHVLAMLCLCVVVAITTARVMFVRSGQSILFRVQTLIVPAAVLVLPVAYCLGAWWWARVTSTTVWEHSWAEGQDDPLWSKLLHLPHNAVGNFADGSDKLFWALSIVLLVILGVVLQRDDGWHKKTAALAVGFFALYAVIPKVFIATFHIYQRFLLVSAFYALGSLPTKWKSSTAWVPAAAATVALLSAVNVSWKIVAIPEIDDAMAIIDDAPPGQALVGLPLAVSPETLSREIWVHLPAHYTLRKKGVIGYTFLRNESVPVHYRPDAAPPHVPAGVEWNGTLYDFAAPYAQAFPLVLITSWRGPDGDVIPPGPSIFNGHETHVRLLSQRGRFFLYDVSPLLQFHADRESHSGL